MFEKGLLKHKKMQKSKDKDKNKRYDLGGECQFKDCDGAWILTIEIMNEWLRFSYFIM